MKYQFGKSTGYEPRTPFFPTVRPPQQQPLPPHKGPEGIGADGSIIYPAKPPLIQSPFRPPIGIPLKPFIQTREGPPVVPVIRGPLAPFRPGAAPKPGIFKPAPLYQKPLAPFRPAVGYKPIAPIAARKPPVAVSRPRVPAVMPRPITPGTAYRPLASAARPAMAPIQHRGFDNMVGCSCYKGEMPFLMKMKQLQFLEEQDYFTMMQRHEMKKLYKKRMERHWWWRHSPNYHLHGPHYRHRHYSQKRWWRNQARYRGSTLGPRAQYGRPSYYKSRNPLIWWRHPANFPARPPIRRQIGYTPIGRGKLGYHPIGVVPRPFLPKRCTTFTHYNHPLLYQRYLHFCNNLIFRHRMKHYYPYYTPGWLRRYHYREFGYPWISYRTPIMYRRPWMRYKPYIYHPWRHPWLYYPYHQYFPPRHFYL